jgi:hypothetical protein
MAAMGLGKNGGIGPAPQGFRRRPSGLGARPEVSPVLLDAPATLGYAEKVRSQLLSLRQLG